MILAASVAVLLLSRAAPANALTNCDAPPDTNAAAEAQMLALMNQARAEAGEGALTMSVSLQRAALWKSNDSTAYGDAFSHTDSLGRNTVMSPPYNRAIDCGYPTWAAENLAWGFPNATSAFNAWMNSPGHRANILDPNALVVGIGFVINHDVPCWAADFGAVPDPEGSVAPPPDNVVTLSPGVNLVVFVGPSQPIGRAVAPLGDDLRAVYQWDAAGQQWQAYFPGAPDYADDLHTMMNGSTYVLIMQQGSVWSQ